ncbi:MAG TPA: biopolymer transporter ExbD [Myxococcales bacterium LLY-WYZ-16_1]|nr:biopolymer transporter ExbD [Myxococcales bacterium LLY-WYZ-16_1]
MELELQRRPRPSLSPELTPLIDVVFQLLVFFLLTTTFTLPAVPLDLPEAKSGHERRDEGAMVLSITESGEIFIEESRLPIDKLDAVVSQRVRLQPNLRVVIRGDVASRYGLFIEVLDACRRAGAKMVLLETRPEAE